MQEIENEIKKLLEKETDNDSKLIKQLKQTILQILKRKEKIMEEIEFNIGGTGI
jgi:hypothetical protein